MESVKRISLVLALALVAAASVSAQSAPEALRPGLTLAQVTPTGEQAVRMVVDPVSRALYFVTLGGNVYRLPPPYAGQTPELAYTAADYGFDAAGPGSTVQGLAGGPDGALYLVANEVDGPTTAGRIVRGRPDGAGGRTWETVARTVPYPRSGTPFDHSFNGITLDPAGAFLYVNSGSRTDHGEVQDQGGLFPGLREVPLTSAILRVPAAATDLVLQDDEPFLRDGGYLFADGVRNSFDLAFDADGRLFGTENAGDRDDSEELNWLREGRHYGFPWRIGMSVTPMQFADYDPAADLLLNPASYAVQQGYFHNDPTYPAPPDGLVFTEPVLNLGPDADRYRDPVDGTVRDAGGAPFATFTPHRSPLGLVFDVAGTLPGPYAGDAFVVSWTPPDDPLLAPFGDEGEDLLHLELAPQGDTYVTTAERIVRGFAYPIDALLLDGTLYVLEYSANGSIWAVSFAEDLAAGPEPPRPAASLDLYPNPLAGAARAVLRVDRTQHVRVAVYDLLGRRVADVFAGRLSAGTPHPLALPADDLPPGTYFLRVEGETFGTVRPFVRAR